MPGEQPRRGRDVPARPHGDLPGERPDRQPGETEQVGLDALLREEADLDWDLGADDKPATGPGERRLLLLVLGVGLSAFLLTWGGLVALPDTGTTGATARASADGHAQASHDPAPDTQHSPETTPSAHPSATASPTPSSLAVTPTPGPLTGRAYDGAVNPVSATGVTATCEDGPSTDGAGSTVTFEPLQATDGDPSTAWRCEGDGTGERLVLRLATAVPLAELSVVPGWAQTDPANGNDRYAQNRRVAEVRWTFDHGAYVDQELSTDPAERGAQTLRIRPVLTSSVTLEVRGTSDDFTRDATAVSEVALGAARKP